MAYYISILTFEKYLHKRKFWNFLKIIFKLLIFKELKMEKNLSSGNVLASACPSRQILQHLTSRWGALVLVSLHSGTKRFSEPVSYTHLTLPTILLV